MSSAALAPAPKAAPPAKMISAGMPDLWHLAVRLAERRDAAELDTLACVLADPAELVAVAEAAGVADETWWGADTRIIWLAAALARDYGTVGVLRVAAKALQAEPGAWDWITPPLPPGGKSPLWNESRLAHLACHYWPCPMLTGFYARRLVAVASQAAAIRRHIQTARELLEGVAA